MARGELRDPRLFRAVLLAGAALLVLVLLALALIPRPGAAQKAAAERWAREVGALGPEPPEAELHLRVVKADRPDLVLELELHNIGHVPIEVDARLTEGAELTALDGKGRVVRCEAAPGPGERPAELWQSETAEVKPGESLRRALDLGRGFATVETVRAWIVDAEGHGRDRPEMHLRSLRLPEGVWPSRIEATFSQAGLRAVLRAQAEVPQ